MMLSLSCYNWSVADSSVTKCERDWIKEVVANAFPMHLGVTVKIKDVVKRKKPCSVPLLGLEAPIIISTLFDQSLKRRR